MKKLLRLLGQTALALALAAGIRAGLDGNLAWAGRDGEFTIGIDAHQRQTDNPEAFGLTVASRTATTTTVKNNLRWDATAGRQFATGPGVFHGIAMSTAAATVYVVCADTATTTNVDTEDTGWTFLGPPVFANTTNSIWGPSGTTGSGGRPPAVSFVNGLYCFSSAAVRYYPFWRARNGN